MTVDPDAQRLLDLLAAIGTRHMQTVPVTESRRAMRAATAVLQPPPLAIGEVRDLTIATEGGPLALRIYRGTACPAAGACGLVWYHGGGWVLGDIETHDGLCRAIAEAAGCGVVAVDYRLAPEFPFPAGLHDAAAAWRHICEHADDFGLNGNKIAIGGDSAGGNLATVVALMARDANHHLPAAQALVYPATDLTATHESYARITGDMPLTTDLVRWFRGLYLQHEGDALDWRASPLRAHSLRDLPPTFILTVGQDPLCDEGLDYARRLDAEGVQVTHLHLPNQVHGFLTMGRLIRTAGFATDIIAGFLRRL